MPAGTASAACGANRGEWGPGTCVNLAVPVVARHCAGPITPSIQ